MAGMITAFYDLASSPPTYDFVSFLVSAERYRIRMRAENILFVIVPGPDHGFRMDQLPPRDPNVRRAMLWNIVVPMCDLLPSSIGCMVCTSRDEANEMRGTCKEAEVFPEGWMVGNKVSHYGTVHMVEAYKDQCFPLAVSLKLYDCRTVTITLRESHYWPTRNSNRDEWLTVAKDLRSRGYRVIFVPDIDSPALHDPDVDSAATTDLKRRARLYASAGLNLFVSNGPAWLATYMRGVNMIVFKMCAPEAPGTNAAFFQGCGFPEGSQVGRAGHRIVWADDKADTILAQVML